MSVSSETEMETVLLEADMAEEEREAAGAHDEAHWCYAQDGDGGGDEDPGQDEVASAQPPVRSRRQRRERR